MRCWDRCYHADDDLCDRCEGPAVDGKTFDFKTGTILLCDRCAFYLDFTDVEPERKKPDRGCGRAERRSRQ